MQILLILSIAFASCAVLFAVQNDMPITVSFAAWSVHSTLAIVLIVALGAGALIASLLSTPAVVGGQNRLRRLQRRVDALEEDKRALQRRIHELDGLAPPDADLPPEEPPPARHPHLGIRSFGRHGYR